jgi:hypothetical protein
MIIGPQGTPYENGCFLFDIYLPEQYNVSCPKVQSMTTNGGRYRYNPNLYADGVSGLHVRGVTELTMKESLPELARHMGRARVDIGKVYATSSLDLDSIPHTVRGAISQRTRLGKLWRSECLRHGAYPRSGAEQTVCGEQSLLCER